MTTYTGTGSTPLAGVGTTRWYRPDADLTLPEQPPADEIDIERERARFDESRDAVRTALTDQRERTAERLGESEAAVFDAHRQFLDDPQIAEDVEAVIGRGSTAEHAVDEVFGDAIKQFEGMEGRMAERADDLRDVRDRLLRELLNVDPVTLSDLPEGTVILAERLTPSDTANLDPEAVVGIATMAGGRTAHAAIIARSLAIPAVVGVGSDLAEIGDGQTVLVDGADGTVVVDPTTDQRGAATGGIDAEIRSERVATSDGTEIEIAANVGSKAELAPASARGADGIGLFRTEFLFLDRDAPPDEDEQYEAVTAALSAFPDERVVVRTLDIGGDKPIPYLTLPDEANPFLGERGVRLSLGRHADLFETQLRALLRAGASEHGDTLAVMVPMVSHVEEITAVKQRIDAVAASLDDDGVDYRVPELGAMIETPAATEMAGDIADAVDFLSIGTNDLTQYVMAVSRENEHLSELHDPLHPPVLRAIRRTVDAGHADDAWVGMCGEMAGDPDLTELLVGLGLDELSMSAVTVPAVKEAVTGVRIDEANALAERVLAADTRSEVVELLGSGA